MRAFPRKSGDRPVPFRRPVHGLEVLMVRFWSCRPSGAGLLAFSLLAASSPPANAQKAFAFIEGRVVGPDGTPVAGVEVGVYGDAPALGVTTLSGADGAFRLGPLPAPGSYRLKCSLGSRQETGPEVAVSRDGEIVETEVRLRL